MNGYGTYLMCDDCGKKKFSAEETICPYQNEVNEKIVRAVLCDECHHERARGV